MFLNSFTTYNLYIKKMKKYLKIWLGGRPDSLNGDNIGQLMEIYGKRVAQRML